MRDIQPTVPHFVSGVARNAAESALARPLTDMVSIVTGATGGIGGAIALTLANAGSDLCITGRRTETLRALAKAVTEFDSQMISYQRDLTSAGAIRDLAAMVCSAFSRVDILVHSAGIMRLGRMADADVEDFDDQYTMNVRLPYLLTQELLPALADSRGQIVFINSSVGIREMRADVGQYAATHHAVRAVADSLRQEVNPLGVRVLSIYLGRTATERQRKLHEAEGKPYKPELLMQPEDVAHVVLSALTLPRTAEMTDVSIRPMIKT